MITKMVMPQVSITTAEVKLVAWQKKVGDSIKRGEPVLEVETDKATVEVESYVDGYLRAMNYPEGATVPVEAVVAVISTTPDESLLDMPQTAITAAAPSSPVRGPEGRRASRLVKTGRIDITPIARKMAEDNHLDLTALKGSGPEGRITREDVEAAINANAQPSVPPAPVSSSPGGSASMRNAIAQQTALSKTTIPHYYVSIEIDMQSVVDLLADFKNQNGGRVVEIPTITDLIIWACGKTLPKFPALNGSWTEQGPVFNPQINIGMVVGLEEGLIVPVIHKADQMSLPELTAKTKRLKQKARGGGLSMGELTGGTFTVSNLGMFGVSTFIAVINPPQSAILALGSMIKRAVVKDEDRILVCPILSATISVDHRMVDGIAAAKFLNALKDAIENPSLLLLAQGTDKERHV